MTSPRHSGVRCKVWSCVRPAATFQPWGEGIVLLGERASTVSWLTDVDGSWFHDRTVARGILRAGIQRIPQGVFTEQANEPQDSIVLHGAATLSLDGIESVDVRRHTAISIEPGAVITWTVVEALERFVVLGGCADGDVVRAPLLQTRQWDDNLLHPYVGDTVLGGEPCRTIAWLREGPERPEACSPVS